MNEILSTKYKQFKEENPKVRIRDAAQQLGTTEAELVAIGERNIRLRPEFEAILDEIPKLGYVMALTRNDDAVHERKGIYTEASFSGKVGFIANEDIDLRLFLFSWQSAFAVQEGDRKSIQFFAKNGTAIHKIYLTEKSDLETYQTLMEKYKMDNAEEALIVESNNTLSTAAKDKAGGDIDITAFQRDWLALKDTHNFFTMLKKHGVGRTKALEIAPEGHTKAISVDNLKTILYKASENSLEIMVFIGNKGCIQIHTGKIEKLVQTGVWFNVLDSEFNMHLREDRIASVWIVRKPTVDGIVSSIEVFDHEGELIAQFFGKRKPGIPESEGWRKILSLMEE